MQQTLPILPYSIEGKSASDNRGILRFVNDFNFTFVKRFYQVENYAKGFIRAWHGHKKEAKYVYVAKGAILLGTVRLNDDLTDKLPLTGPSDFILTSEKPRIIYIPPNHANGFKTLTDDAIVQFFSTSTLEESRNDDYRFPWDKWNIWDIEYR